MPHQPVIERGAKTGDRHRLAGKFAGDLMQSEQFEMVDKERAGQYDPPAEQ